MAYKARFRPLERLTPDGWRPFGLPECNPADALVRRPEQGPDS
jgi:hypothetical protein